MSGHIPAEEAAELFWNKLDPLCEACQGRGYCVEPAHDPRCRGDCNYCPVEIQVPCPNCGSHNMRRVE